MKQIYTIFLLLALIFGIRTVHAQESTTSYGLLIDDITLQHTANRLEVDFSILLDGVKIRSNQAIRLTPYLTDGSDMMQLPAVIINGRRRYISHERNKSDLYESANTYIRHRNNEAQEIDYQTNVPYESWMSRSELILREECISCHDYPLDEALIPLAMLNEKGSDKASAPTSQKPSYAYMTPKSTSSSVSQKTFNILFPVNKSTINPSFMDNAAQIESIHQSFGQTSDIKSIHLMGYASPEGPYTFNETLATKRAEAVKSHIAECNLPSDIKISWASSPANWDEVKRLLNESCIENYLKIIEVIDDQTISPADKNKTIKERFPVQYDFMLRTWYPQLRTTEITVDFTQGDLSLDEAKAQLKKDPSRLSLEDIYMVALTFDKGSKEWQDVILIALQTYPESPEARINAANVAMANGDYNQAAEYLKGVPANIPQAMNSRGILAMAQGNLQQALQLFQSASQAGLREATQNISLVKALIAAES
ncbi:MAG: DUF3868 domain-containing protein [Alistipes sp.]|nr:DUF3868 domain-containing protein [Alistipes sp.]